MQPEMIEASPTQSSQFSWAFFSRWFKRLMSMAGVVGVVITLAYFINIGYAPIDSLAGLGAIAGFVALVSIAMALSFTLLWGLPAMIWLLVQQEGKDNHALDGLRKRDTQPQLTKATKVEFSVPRIAVLSLSAFVCPWLFFFATVTPEYFHGQSSYVQTLAAIFFVVASAPFLLDGTLQKSKEAPGAATWQVSVRLFILCCLAAASLVPQLPFLLLITKSPLVVSNDHWVVLLLILFGMAVLFVSQGILLLILEPLKSRNTKTALLIAVPVLSIFFMMIEMQSTTGILNQIMTVTTMRIPHARLAIKPDICTALAPTVKGATPIDASKGCVIVDALVGSRMGDQWWISCDGDANSGADAKANAPLRGTGYAIPKDAITTWSRLPSKSDTAPILPPLESSLLCGAQLATPKTIIGKHPS